MNNKLREKKLLIGFGVFLILTLSIGAIGISQIQLLSKTIEQMGQVQLPRERAISKIKIANALYAMGVRNYVFWQTSKYLKALPFVSDVNFGDKFSSDFKRYSGMYSLLASGNKQKIWIATLTQWTQDLKDIGQNIVELADREASDKRKMNKLLVDFEDKFHRIDDFLSGTLTKDNLQSIEEQLKLTEKKKNFSQLVLLVSLSFSALLGLSIAYFVYSSLKDERKRREALTQRMIRLEEEERKSLSFQIHDELSQDLSALRIYLGLIDNDIPSEHKDQKDKIDKSKKILTDLIEKGHNISDLLRPPELDDLGLIEAIGALIAEHREMRQADYIYHKPLSGPQIKLPFEYSLTLYRIAQEALTNIAKHSNAKNVEVSLSKKRGKVSLVISDDGEGFNYTSFLRRPRRRREDKLRLGLQGFRERIELLGGFLSIKTSPGKGTKVKVELSC